MELLNCFIPAGYGENQGHYSDLLHETKVDNKAMIRLANKPIIEYVIDALDASKYVQSITIAGLSPQELQIQTEKPLLYIEGGSTSFETIKKASEFLRERSNPEYIVNVSSDIPLITTEMIDRIFETIDWSTNKELYWNMVWIKDLRRLYPNVTKIPLKLKEGYMVGGDFHIFKPSVLDGRESTLELMMSHRKSVFGMMKVISLRYIIKYLLGRLSIRDIDQRFRTLFDLDAAFLITRFPETCVDLDFTLDLREFEKLIRRSPRQLDDDEIVELIYYEN